MTRKRRPSLDSSQLGFTFEPPVPARAPADLAGIERKIAAGVAQALKDDARSRRVIAAEMSALLDDEVTPTMLDAYASEARDNHNISAARWLALIAVTDRFDIYDAISRAIGASVLVGEELRAAHIGHIRSRMRQLQKDLRRLEAGEPLINKNRGHQA